MTLPSIILLGKMVQGTAPSNWQILVLDRHNDIPIRRDVDSIFIDRGHVSFVTGDRCAFRGDAHWSDMPLCCHEFRFPDTHIYESEPGSFYLDEEIALINSIHPLWVTEAPTS